ncbi:hypothetical protein NA56DRAFT_683033 [Hyaloscypha hepaticicola]|uniref:Cora-domain-containing protein n=1 Tax=Hyaloscypha hepaticicola TaxID=2082293 RepID=A0A2J6PH33_9HELO|nr:hypothetical protein NA56DRAFT_683033 [Hyaloscypha hepaticicola]
MAEISPDQTLQGVKEYQYFQPELIKLIASENIYDEDQNGGGQPPWEIDDRERPYLKYVKALRSWRHLRLLADFMQVGTTPLRWKELKDKPSNRQERASRTKVTRLDYHEGLSKPIRQEITTSSKLREILHEQASENGPGKRKFRLFIIEDLSRDVIELLGAHYDVDPAFFRDQIFDYAWYNTRDRWIDPPRMHVVTKRQQWIQIRFATSRYFEDQVIFKSGCDQSESFNVYRRLEDDSNNTGTWDAEKAIVGLSRTRAAFWLGKAGSHVEGPVGILLVDPTVTEGYSLWHGYRNWEETPSMKDLESMEGKMPPPGPTRKSFFDDLIYWLEKPEAFGPSTASNCAVNIHVPMQALLYLICGEWLTITEYIQTRLAQVEWEISFPEHFLNSGKRIDVALKKLHIWRRLVPLYHRMLTETLQHRLTSVVTASISIDDSHRGLQDTRNVTRLTWLATCFIPLSLTASIFSMQSDIVNVRPILGWYFLISLLLVLVTIGGAFILTGSVVTKQVIGIRESVETHHKNKKT